MASNRSLQHSYSPELEKTRIRLPNINNPRSPMVDENEDYENPFYVPPDEEIFKMKSKEKETKELEKSRIQSQKIWQKGLKNASEGKLRKIRELTNFEEEQEDDDGKLNIVEAAKSAIRNRIRHKEPLLNFLNKKREMFLFQMSINEKKEQIKEFEELAHLQEISLQNSKDLLEKDAETFKQHVEKNKNETRQAIKNAEDETKEKQKKINKMKQTHEALSTIMSQNMKNLEKLEKLYGYKLFLDRLTPDDFLLAQQRLKDERNKAKNVLAIGDGQKNNQANEELKWTSYNLNLSPGVLAFLADEEDESEMYFKKDSNQLQELFENLEEKNLFIIKYNQDLEQSLEDLKHSIAVKQADLLERKGQLEKNKRELENAIGLRRSNINQLHVRTDKFTESTLGMLENAIQAIYEKCKFLKEGKVDQQMSGIEILTMIERKVEGQLMNLTQLPFQKIFDLYKLCINARREEVNRMKKQQSIEEQNKKLEIIKKRLMAQKRFGRPIMAKSMLKKQDKEEAQTDVEDEEQIEKRLYFSPRFE